MASRVSLIPLSKNGISLATGLLTLAFSEVHRSAYKRKNCAEFALKPHLYAIVSIEGSRKGEADSNNIDTCYSIYIYSGSTTATHDCECYQLT
jgi:hypothetical protein